MPKTLPSSRMQLIEALMRMRSFLYRRSDFSGRSTLSTRRSVSEGMKGKKTTTQPLTTIRKSRAFHPLAK